MDEIHLRSGLSAKTAVAIYVSIFQGIMTRLIQAEYKNFRIMLENNIATTELTITGLTERDLQLIQLIRQELDEPAHTAAISSRYHGGGARLD